MRITAIIHEGNTYYLANPDDTVWRNLYVYLFGGYTRVIVRASGFEDGLAEAADYLKDTGKVGYFTPDGEIQELVKEVREEDPELDDDEAYEKATVDLYYTEAGYIPSDDWNGWDAGDDLRARVDGVTAFHSMHDDWLDRDRCETCDRALLREECKGPRVYGSQPYQVRMHGEYVVNSQWAEYCSPDCRDSDEE